MTPAELAQKLRDTVNGNATIMRADVLEAAAILDRHDLGRNDRHESLREYARAALTGACANPRMNADNALLASCVWDLAEAMQREDEKHKEAGL